MNWLKQLYKYFLYPVSTNRIFYLYLYLGSLALAVVGNINGQHNDVFLAILIPIWGTYLYCLLATALKPIRLHWLAWLLSSVLLLGEIFCGLFNNSMFSVNLVRIVLETTDRESLEFLSGLWALPSLWITIACGVGSLLLAWGITKGYNYLPRLVRKIIVALLAICTIWSAIRTEGSHITLIRCFTLESVPQLNEERYMPCLRTPLLRFGYGAAFTRLQAREYVELIPSVENTVVDSCSFRSPMIVLIIGESYNKYHTPLYNPESLPTTPNMSRMHDEGSLYVFTDVVTQSNLTAYVMQNMVSTWSEDCHDNWTKHSLLTAVFKKAGYDVYSWSNHYVMQGDNSLFTNLGGVIFNHPTLSDLQFTARNEHLYKYDGLLLEDMPDSMYLPSRPTLLIYHVMGQHVNYADRYPAEAAYFTADDIKPGYGGAHGQKITAEYSNATRYNDSLINVLWERVKHRDVIAIYLSDHGEECYDYRSFYERSDQNHLTPEIAHYQFEIPFFIMVSDSFRINHPDIVEQVAASVDKPFVNSDICHMLFSLAGIRTADYRADRDLLSPEYITNRPRYIGDHVDYNELIRQLK